MKKIYFALTLSFFLIQINAGFCTTHTIVNSAFTFSPDSVSATVGDTIKFTLSAFHSSIEVDDTTWALNHNTSNGGWVLPLGGGMVVVTTAKTYYYVCGAHYAMGMKGRVFVQNSSQVTAYSVSSPQLLITPNPATSNFTVSVNSKIESAVWNLEIFNVKGDKVYSEALKQKQEVFSTKPYSSGIYFVKVSNGESVEVKKLIIE